MNQQNQGQVSENMARFANCLALIGSFFASTYILKYAKPFMYHYLLSFGEQSAYWGSWAFVAVCVVGTYFGLSMFGEVVLRTRFTFLRGNRGHY